MFISVLFPIAFVALEGTASLVILVWELAFKQNHGLYSRNHVQYDELLGWINIPDLNLPDFYRPGASFVTNSCSNRNDVELERSVQPGKVRVLCAGDSFILDIDVDITQTWCALLAEHGPRLETVNLGEASYGFGQTYLK